jgi:hypothetical protein
LRGAGHEVILHHERFPSGADDVDWLTALHEHRLQWVVLTKDEQIRKNPLERRAYITSGVRVFALTAANLSSSQQASAFLKALRKIVRTAQQPGPYIARVTGSGNAKIIERPKPGGRKKHRMEP